MSFKYLLVSEKNTVKQSSHHVGGWISTFPTSIDCLFKASYFTGTGDAPDTPNGSFHAFAHHDYLRIPYTIRVISLLIESGYYLEATVLLRNVYEVFIQLRYFHKHKEKLADHVLNKHRIRFKTMFEEYSPGCYEFLYAAQLSEYAHGGFGSMIFRTKYSSPTKGETIMGCEFDPKWCSFVMNQLVALVYGFLNFIPEFFPKYLQSAPTRIEQQRLKSLAWLEEAMSNHLAGNPKSKKFYNYVDALVRLTTRKHGA